MSALRVRHPRNSRQRNAQCGASADCDGAEAAASSYGSTFPGFMIPSGSSAALIRRIASSSAPPRHPGIM